jgi:hypothetical protein
VSNPQATFDYSKVGRQWQLEFAQSAEQATRASLLLERPMRKQKPDESAEAYDDAVQAFYDAKDKALGELNRLGDVQAELLTHVLVAVPREWLLADAPETIDWSQVESLNYIQMDHYGQIVNMVRSGEAMKKAKN